MTSHLAQLAWTNTTMSFLRQISPAFPACSPANISGQVAVLKKLQRGSSSRGDKGKASTAAIEHAPFFRACPVPTTEAPAAHSYGAPAATGAEKAAAAAAATGLSSQDLGYISSLQ